jgi:oxygen-independent coproporphyrinogen-3 oxidase
MLLQGESITPMSPQPHPGLYIHVPFCRTKCPYCDFYSCTDMQQVKDFIRLLEKELLYYCKSFPAVDTVYLGGGTPTVLPDSALASIMTMVRRHVAVAPDAEITLEANPNDLSLERLIHFRSLGFNRLSLGVQSFDDDVLRFLGRRHTADEARESIKQGRQAGFATLREALRFAPEHLSCYQLTIKEETPFFARVQEGSVQPCTEEEQAELFMATSAFLEEQGYCHYEVSNFCRCENLQARHNRTYWEHGPYLGLGPSAHSFDGRRRWWNVKPVEGYCEKLKAGLVPVEAEEELTDEQLRTEALLLGLRTRKGIALDALPAPPLASRGLERLLAEGLVIVASNRIAPTTRGLLLADYVSVVLSTE